MKDNELIWILGLCLLVSLSINAFYVVENFNDDMPFDTLHRYALESNINYSTFGNTCFNDDTISIDVKKCFIYYYFSNEIKIQSDYEKYSGSQNETMS